MTDISLQAIVEIYSWIVAVFIMIFIAAIGNFYQKKFKVRTFYSLYWIPIIILLVAALQIFSHHTLLSEMLELFGSICSFLVSFFLYRKMVGLK